MGAVFERVYLLCPSSNATPFASSARGSMGGGAFLGRSTEAGHFAFVGWDGCAAGSMIAARPRQATDPDREPCAREEMNR